MQKTKLGQISFREIQILTPLPDKFGANYSSTGGSQILTIIGQNWGK